jgi:ABC-type branched-subunit amino acid transport system ATPase component
MIEARSLVKRYGATAAVNDLSFTIRPGQVAGFLGPNGAGKTTTMRLILGLDYPSAGSVTVNGRPYALRARRSSPRRWWKARREHLRQARPGPLRQRQPPGHRRHQVPRVLMRQLAALWLRVIVQ